MFTIVAATLFFAAFLLSVSTIAWMFTLYHEKMMAALRFEPIPQGPAVYHVRIRRPRARKAMRRAAPAPRGGVLAA